MYWSYNHTSVFMLFWNNHTYSIYVYVCVYIYIYTHTVYMQRFSPYLQLLWRTFNTGAHLNGSSKSHLMHNDNGDTAAGQTSTMMSLKRHFQKKIHPYNVLFPRVSLSTCQGKERGEQPSYWPTLGDTRSECHTVLSHKRTIQIKLHTKMLQWDNVLTEICWIINIITYHSLCNSVHTLTFCISVKKYWSVQINSASSFWLRQKSLKWLSKYSVWFRFFPRCFHFRWHEKGQHAETQICLHDLKYRDVFISNVRDFDWKKCERKI